MTAVTILVCVVPAPGFLRFVSRLFTCQWTTISVPVTCCLSTPFSFHQSEHCRNFDWKHSRHPVRLELQGQSKPSSSRIYRVMSIAPVVCVVLAPGIFQLSDVFLCASGLQSSCQLCFFFFVNSTLTRLSISEDASLICPAAHAGMLALSHATERTSTGVRLQC